MTLAEFNRTLTADTPPANFVPALAALWWAGKDDWERAHRIVMAESSKDCAWVHAYLHRAEGDLANARYWYRNAGRPAAVGDLKAEWAAIAAAMLAMGTDI